MPSSPEVCPTAFCPLNNNSNYETSASRIVTWLHRLVAVPFVLRFIPSLVVLLLVISHPSSLRAVHAQGGTATLRGTVKDQTGALIPGVNIEVLTVDKGFRRRATTNDEGAFIVTSLPPSTYVVKAEREGFNTAEVRDVVLNVNSQMHIDIELIVGMAGETVNVVDK